MMNTFKSNQTHHLDHELFAQLMLLIELIHVVLLRRVEYEHCVEQGINVQQYFQTRIMEGKLNEVIG